MIFSGKYDFLEYIATFGPFGVSIDTTCIEQLYPYMWFSILCGKNIFYNENECFEPAF